jgi:flagellar export protein FliJ
MADKLATLIRLHTWRLDEQWHALADALRELDRLRQASRALEAEIAAEQEAAAAAPAEAGLAYARYARVAVERRAACREASFVAEAEIASRREKVQVCYRELRTLEIARDNRRQRAKAEAARREALMLDEIGLIAHSRSGDEATSEVV